MEVDLNPLINGGTLEVTEPTGSAELEQFMHLAGIIDDGEAACLAIASQRGHILATDDRRAIKVATELNVSIVTTPDLIKKWVESTLPEPFQVMDTIRCIERYGRFRPHPSSPHAKWWEEQLRWNH
jgi:predicted nucleic acid-binding protein